MRNSYQAKEYRDCSQNGSDKKEGYDNRPAFRISLEDVMDFWKLAISQWLLVFGLRCVRINFNVEIEDVIAEGLGSTERCEN
jgi:hypothetical protein